MNELATYQGGLPDTAEDLAHFLLIAPEKATALRAEIRAIDKACFAKAVYDQKLEEQRRLCDMILDASVRLGEITKAMAKAPAGRKPELPDNAVGYYSEKAKTERITELGFSPKQVERFETLAANKDLVEQEKATAREENRMPTRTNVLSLAKARRDKYERDMAQIDADGKLAKAFVKAAYAVQELPDATEVAAALVRNAGGDTESLNSDIENTEAAIACFREIQNELRKEVAKNGRI